MIKAGKSQVIVTVIIFVLILLSVLFLIDYFKPKIYEGLFKCEVCGYAFTQKVHYKAKLPIACPKCKKKTAYLAAEFFCPECKSNHTLILEIPPWEAKEIGEPLEALYTESLVYTMKSKKIKCPQCGKEMLIKDEALKDKLQREEKEIEERLEKEKEKYEK